MTNESVDCHKPYETHTNFGKIIVRVPGDPPVLHANRGLCLPKTVHRTDQDAELLGDQFEGLVPVEVGILPDLVCSVVLPFLILLHTVCDDGTDARQDANHDRKGVDELVVVIIGANDDCFVHFGYGDRCCVHGSCKVVLTPLAGSTTSSF